MAASVKDVSAQDIIDLLAREYVAAKTDDARKAVAAVVFGLSEIIVTPEHAEDFMKHVVLASFELMKAEGK